MSDVSCCFYTKAATPPLCKTPRHRRHLTAGIRPLEKIRVCALTRKAYILVTTNLQNWSCRFDSYPAPPNFMGQLKSSLSNLRGRDEIFEEVKGCGGEEVKTQGRDSPTHLITRSPLRSFCRAPTGRAYIPHQNNKVRVKGNTLQA